MRVTRSVPIIRRAADVFAFIEDPASQLLLEDEVVAAVRMPGTGPGVGEVQVFLHATPEGRSIRSLEVLEYEPSTRVLVRSLDPLPAGMLEATTELSISADGPDSCVMRHTARYVLAAAALAEPAASQWAGYLGSWLESMHVRAQRTLEADLA
ncbi:MAG: hypothetical protein ACTHJJ_07915 [Intrasporangium sp.]